MAFVLDLPMLTDQAQQPLRTRPVRTKAGDPVDYLVALRPARLDGDVTLDLDHLGQPRPVTVPHQRRTGGQAARLDGMTEYKNENNAFRELDNDQQVSVAQP